jgi:hypothetical protein
MRATKDTIPRAHRALWNGLNEFARECGGWTTSEPGTFPLRFECQMGSSLPEGLRQLGHSIYHLGTHERIIPQTIVEVRGTKTFTNRQMAPGIVDVWELSIIRNSNVAVS